MLGRALAILCCVVIGPALAGCESPFADDVPRSLRQRVIDDARARLAAGHAAGPMELAPVYSPQKQARLDALTSPRRHGEVPINVGTGLDGSQPQTVELTLQVAINSAITHNLAIANARLIPEIRQTQVDESVAVFDWTLFGRGSVGRTDRPQPASALNGVAVGADSTIQDTSSLLVGLRKRTPIGGSLEISAGTDYLNDKTPRLDFLPDPSWTSTLAVTMTQPLLRNFGEQVNGAQIRLARNATARDEYALREQLLVTVAQTEVAYWRVVFARHRVGVVEELLEITIQTRDELIQRRGVDVNPVQMAQAEREVNLRRGELARARRELHDRSDELKRLMLMPELPLVGEAVIDPTNYPDEAPRRYTLRDAVATALSLRPDLTALLIEVDDARIRRAVAENQRLPQLDVTGEVRHRGLADQFDQSVENFDEDFTEWLVGFEFERPIGNRAAEAVYRRTRLEQQLRAIRFKDASADVVLEVKQAMRAMNTAHEVMQLARRTRRAAAENLRALREREKTGQELTPEFLLDLKLRTQQRLADAEVAELQAVVEYAIARVQYHQATGQLLIQRGLRIESPADGERKPN